MIEKMKKLASEKTEAVLEIVSGKVEAAQRTARALDLLRKERELTDRIWILFDSLGLALDHKEQLQMNGKVVRYLGLSEDGQTISVGSDGSKWTFTAFHAPNAYREILRETGVARARRSKDMGADLDAARSLQRYTESAPTISRILQTWGDIYKQHVSGPDQVTLFFDQLITAMGLIKYEADNRGAAISRINQAGAQVTELYASIRPALHAWQAGDRMERQNQELAHDIVWMYEWLVRERRPHRAYRDDLKFMVTLTRAKKNLEQLNSDIRLSEVFLCNEAEHRLRMAVQWYQDKGGWPADGQFKPADTEMFAPHLYKMVRLTPEITVAEAMIGLARRSVYGKVIRYEDRGWLPYKAIEVKSIVDAGRHERTGRATDSLDNLMDLIWQAAADKIAKRHVLLSGTQTPDGPATKGTWMSDKNLLRFFMLRRRKSKGEYQPLRNRPAWRLTRWDQATGDYVPMDNMPMKDVLAKWPGLHVKCERPLPVTITDLLEAVAVMELSSPNLNIVHALGIKHGLEQNCPGSYQRLIERYEGKSYGMPGKTQVKPYIGKVYRLDY